MIFISISFVLTTVSCITDFATGAPATAKNETKRFYGKPTKHIQQSKNVRGQAKDYMNEIIGSALHGHKSHPDKWMDFYDNGASWDRYMSPQLHHPKHFTVHDPHYDVRLSFDDHSEANQHVAAEQANHVEAYPGEIVSGENSLSKFIAPPVFDEPFDHDNNAHSKQFILKSPEEEATEAQNTKNLVDSLKSLMTPLKVPEENENKETVPEAPLPSWRNENKQINSLISEETKESQNEARHHQYDMNYDDGPRHETASSRENLGRAESNDASFNEDPANSRETLGRAESNDASFSQDPSERFSDYDEKDYKSRNYDGEDKNADRFEHHEENPANFADNEDLRPHNNDDDIDNEIYKSNENEIEKFHDSRENSDELSDMKDMKFRNNYENDDYAENYKESENSNNRDYLDNQDNYEHSTTDFKHEKPEYPGQSALELSDPQGAPAEKHKPIEVVQDDSGRSIKSYQGNVQAKYLFENDKNGIEDTRNEDY